jgi:hypothetical protein
VAGNDARRMKATSISQRKRKWRRARVDLQETKSTAGSSRSKEEGRDRQTRRDTKKEALSNCGNNELTSPTEKCSKTAN